jgi:hypothetical protein
VPDHGVELRIEDVIEGTDTIKEYVLRLLVEASEQHSRD